MRRLLWPLAVIIGFGIGGLLVQRLWLRPAEAELHELRKRADQMCYWVAAELRQLDRPGIQPEELTLAVGCLRPAVKYCAPDAEASIAAISAAAVMENDIAKARRTAVETAAMVAPPSPEERTPKR